MNQTTITLNNGGKIPQFGMGVFMEKAVAQGKVRAIGLSNFESDRLEEVIAAAEIKPAVLQVELHPYFQQKALKERVAACGTVLEAWYPLGHGDSGLPTSTQILSGFLQALGQGTASFVVAISQAAFLLLSAWLLSLTGSAVLVWLAFPIMEVLRFVIAAMMVGHTYQGKLAVLQPQAA